MRAMILIQSLALASPCRALAGVMAALLVAGLFPIQRDLNLEIAHSSLSLGSSGLPVRIGFFAGIAALGLAVAAKNGATQLHQVLVVECRVYVARRIPQHCE